MRDRPLRLIGGGGRRAAVRVGLGSVAKRTAGPVAAAPGFLSAIRLMSSGMPMPMSVLRKQAQPGGRKRSARAVNDGLDGRSERQASGRGHPRAAASWLHGKTRHPVGLSLAGLRPLVLIGDILSPGGSKGVGLVASPNVLRVQSLPLLAFLLRYV